jgi:thioredoxin-like negative regulator of GroEL
VSGIQAERPGPKHFAFRSTQLANLLMQQGRRAEAVPALRQVASADPANQEARIALALALLDSGDLSAAAGEIEFLTVAPGRAEVLLLRGLLQVAADDLASARETVGEIKKRYPGLRLPPALDALP